MADCLSCVCIRGSGPTAIVRMKSGGIEDKKIWAVSAHNNSNSLHSYDRVSSSDVCHMADSIDCKPKLASDVPAATVDSASKSKLVLKPPLSNAEHISDGLVLNSCTNVPISVCIVASHEAY